MGFYKLTTEELLQMRDLTPSQIVVLLYLKTLDPFCEKKLNLSIRKIANDLNLARSTVASCLESLHNNGYINREVTHMTVSIIAYDKKSTSSKGNSDEGGKKIDRADLPMQENRQGGGKKIDRGWQENRQGVARKSTGGDNTQPQTEQEPRDFSTASKTRSDYKDQDQIEGDRFLEFVIAQLRAKGIDMANPVAYAKKCISDRPDYWRGLWQEANHRGRPPSLEMLIGGFRQALKAKDWAFARKRVLEIQEIAPEIAQQLEQEINECANKVL
jgi:predicted DNA-binding transcriptional regulator